MNTLAFVVAIGAFLVFGVVLLAALLPFITHAQSVLPR